MALFLNTPRMREGNLVSMWQLINLRQSRGIGKPADFSTKTYKQFDCVEQRVRLLAFRQFSQRMGAGLSADGLVDKDKWLSIEQESINQALWEIACNKN